MDEQRQRVVEVARTWLRTPYHHQGRVKGVGVDCATLLAEVACEAGLVERVEIPFYSSQWHLHRGEERYLDTVLCYAREIEWSPGPGDIVLWRFGRCFSHGAIVVAWPVIIHARINAGVEYEDAEQAAWLKQIGEGEGIGRVRPRKFFSPWGDPA
jgi:cell wall-associated NlpC family hydrolase